jgi:hypothetical protein
MLLTFRTAQKQSIMRSDVDRLLMLFGVVKLFADFTMRVR